MKASALESVVPVSVSTTMSVFSGRGGAAHVSVASPAVALGSTAAAASAHSSRSRLTHSVVMMVMAMPLSSRRA